MELHFLLLALATIFAVTMAGPQGRITYGSLATEFQFPYQVGLSRDRMDLLNPYCSGAVLSKNWVVTAAHCVYGLQKINLHFGSINYTAPKFNLTIQANDIKINPKFVYDSLENDCALIKTPDLPLSAYIWPVPLPPMSLIEEDFVGKHVIASGWGQGSSNRALLNWARLSIISNEECAITYDKDYRITNSKICASTSGGVSTCNGDSGGPLVLETSRSLVGITSFGKACTASNPAGFTRVTAVLPWIKQVTGLSS